jgi:hypothetical protein
MEHTMFVDHYAGSFVCLVHQMILSYMQKVSDKV